MVTKRKVLTANERKVILDSIAAGNLDATRFHKISYDNLIHIFGKRLSRPVREREINQGRKRIDIVFTNSDRRGFFYSLNALHHIKCPKILAECKNYGQEIGNPEIDQLLGRFSSFRGRFGLLLCRSVENRKLIIDRCRDSLKDQKNCIIVLDDADIITLLKYRENNDDDEIDNLCLKS
ncbi:MAG: hypothetical protein WDM90_21110 [Ferruginibacter sp.]